MNWVGQVAETMTSIEHAMNRNQEKVIGFWDAAMRLESLGCATEGKAGIKGPGKTLASGIYAPRCPRKRDCFIQGSKPTLYHSSIQSII